MGFSLLEAMVVLLVLSITAVTVSGSLSLPAIIRNESDVLALRLREAQLLSAEGGTVIASSECVDEIDLCLFAPRGEMTLSPHKMRFFSPLVNSPASLRIEGSRDSCEISVSLRGRVRVTCERE